MRRAVLTVSPAQLLDLQWPRRALPLCSPTSRSCAHGSTRAHTVLSPEKDPPYKCCQGHQHWLGGRQKQCRRWPANVDTRDGWRRWYLPPACHARHRISSPQRMLAQRSAPRADRPDHAFSKWSNPSSITSNSRTDLAITLVVLAAD